MLSHQSETFFFLRGLKVITFLATLFFLTVHLMFTLENEVKVLFFDPPESLKKNPPQMFNVIGEMTAFKGALKITATQIL